MLTSTATVNKTMRSFPIISKDKYFEWKRYVETTYEGHCKDIHLHGLLDLLLECPEWLALNGDADRPARTIPAEPPNNAAHATVSFFIRTCTNVGRSLAIKAELKVLLLESIGLTNVMRLRDPITDTRNITELQIMTEMHTKYSQLSTDTLALWRTSLAVPISDALDIEDFLAEHKNLHDNFEAVQQPMSESDNIVAAIKALTPRTAASMAITKYKMDTPNAAAQSYKNFADFLVLQVPNMDVTLSSSGFASHSAAADLEMRVAAAIDARLDAAVDARLAAMGFAALMQTGSGTVPPSTKPKRSMYCYKHGYTSTHTGAQCLAMANDTRKYTKATVTAKNPTAVPGGSTNHS